MAKGGHAMKPRLPEPAGPAKGADHLEAAFLYTPSALERLVLVVGLAYPPFGVPLQVTHGVMGSAYSRVRILANVTMFFTAMAITDLAIADARVNVDHPDTKSLYTKPDIPDEVAAATPPVAPA
mmetsp:Transcript_29689/g.88823  ORF Transcript_29689/g.88823 Transcript_29689/m.88823 type:complete len:124 (+) Transcript_29689:122-493(+)